MYKSHQYNSLFPKHPSALRSKWSACALILFLFSCSNLFIDEQRSNTMQNNFDLLWTIIDERYCFFEEKGINWDEIYKKYRIELYFFSNTDPNSHHFYNTMTKMLEELCDGHVCLDNGDFSRCYSGWYSGFSENFESRRIGFYRNQDQNTILMENETTVSILPNGIGYIRCPTFSDKFNRIELDNAIARFNEHNVRGVIVDVRNNGGGFVSEAYLLASKFVRGRTHVGYKRYKTGKGHNDFSDYFAQYVEPGGAHQFHGKVAVLTNRRVYSAANLFVSIMSNLLHARTIGDQTGGGGGVPISAELYNGWAVKFSTNPVYDTEYVSIEQGIIPIQSVALTTNNNRNNNERDNIIEAAIEWILTN